MQLSDMQIWDTFQVLRKHAMGNQKFGSFGVWSEATGSSLFQTETASHNSIINLKLFWASAKYLLLKSQSRLFSVAG